MKLTVEDFEKLGVKEAHIKPLIGEINKWFEKFSINTTNRLVDSLANILHETARFRYSEEIGGSNSYDGGVLYKGRGIVQLTHKYNYLAFQNWLKGLGIVVDLVKTPQLISQRADLSVLSFIWFWEANNFSKLSDEGKFKEICAIWNTGKADRPIERINGWKERCEYKVKVEAWLQDMIDGL
jgi:predicted chitinase